MNLEDTKRDILNTIGLHYDFEIIDLSDSGANFDNNELSISIKSKIPINKKDIIKILEKIERRLHIIVYNDMVAILVDASEPHTS